MSYIVGGDYNYLHSYHEGKIGYINQYEKSLKLPFLNVMTSHLPGTRPVDTYDLKIDKSDTAVNDIIELSSAVVSASDAGGSDVSGSGI